MSDNTPETKTVSRDLLESLNGLGNVRPSSGASVSTNTPAGKGSTTGSANKSSK